MLSKFQYKLFEFTLFLTSRLGIVPIIWNNEIVSRRSNWIQTIFSLTFALLQILNCAWFCLNAREQFDRNDANSGLLCSIMGVTSMSAAVMILTLEIFPDEYCALANEVRRVNRKFGKEYFQSEFLERTWTDRLYFGIVLIAAIAGPVACSQCIWFSVNFSTSITFIIIYPLSVFMAYAVGSTYLVLEVALFVLSIQTLQFWVKEFGKTWTGKSIEVKFEVKKPSYLVYRTMEMLNLLHNTVFGTMLMPTIQLAALQVFCIAVYGVVILRSVIPTFTFIFLLLNVFIVGCVLVPAAQLMSSVFNLSSEAIRESERHVVGDCVDATRTRRIIKSLRPLKSDMGGFYYMEGEAKLTLLDNIGRGIGFMLVSFK